MPLLPQRQPCPPAACTCGRAALLADPNGDARILRLTRAEEQRLAARLEAVESLAQLQHLRTLMHAQLGLTLTLRPATREVRSLRGIFIRVEPAPGVCRKIRQSIPAAIRRALTRRPEIAYAILDAHDLLGGSQAPPVAN